MNEKPAQFAGNDIATVTFRRRDIEDARRILLLLSESERSAPCETPQVPRAVNESVRDPQTLHEIAMEILRRRKKRHQIFGKGIFGEPAWEMLLLLYTNEPLARQTISRLSDLAEASRSTGLRWIDYLEAQKLVRREPHPTDRRAAFVELTEKGKHALQQYLSSLR